MEGKAPFLSISQVLVQVFLLHHKLENRLLFLGNALAWELGESMCKNQTASLSTTVSADLPNRGAALNTSNVFTSENIVKDNEQLELQRAPGPLRQISILLGSANLF